MTNQEAIARIREHKIIHKMNEPRAIYISEALDMAIEALENQKTGHWISDTVDGWFKCSECEHFELGKTTYCSSCGAKMEGEKK